MDTDSFIVHVKAEEIHTDLVGDVEERFDTTNQEVKKYTQGKTKKNLADKDQLSEKKKKKKDFVALRPNMYYSYLIDENFADKKTKRTKKYVQEQKINFQDYKKYLEKKKTILKSQQRFRSEEHNVFTEKFNKIALGANNNKRIQTLDGVVILYLWEQVLQ